MKIKKYFFFLKCSSKYLRNAKYHHKAFILIKEIIVSIFYNSKKKVFTACAKAIFLSLLYKIG